MTICVLTGLTKYYGAQRGIENVSFDVREGEVFGFLGANGAGKTTALRVIMGLLHPTSGSVTVLGRDVTRHGPEVRASIGYLPGSLALYGGYTGREFLSFLASMRQRDCTPAYEELAERLYLELDKHINELSKGNRQKVGLIQALMHSPRLLLLDEPTSGLDPVIQREFETMLSELRTRGASVIFSSHVLSEVEHQADRVAVLHEGHLVRVGPVDELRGQARRTIDLAFAKPPDLGAFVRQPGVIEASLHGNVVTCTVRGDERALLAEAVAQHVTTVRTHEQSLEDVFFELIGRGDAHALATGSQDAS